MSTPFQKKSPATPSPHTPPTPSSSTLFRPHLAGTPVSPLTAPTPFPPDFLVRTPLVWRGAASLRPPLASPAMAVDLTPAFHVALYLVFLESLLFFAVIMQTKSVEPGTHSGVARYFGLVFLFQALASLFLALGEQLYKGYFSLYFSVMAAICIVIAVCFCVPAATAVAVPEPNNQCLQATVFIASVVVILLTTFAVSGHLNAAPDIPYLNLFLRRELLGAIGGAFLVLAAASTIRMLRQLKGGKGAFILLAGLALIAAFGILWARLEPLCKQKAAGEPWPPACPMPATFDHNFMIAVLIMIANVLAAEGILRLMAAGSGVVGYVEIIPV